MVGSPFAGPTATGPIRNTRPGRKPCCHGQFDRSRSIPDGMQQTWLLSSMPWTCCMAAVSMGFASCPTMATLPALPSVPAKTDFLSSALVRRLSLQLRAACDDVVELAASVKQAPAAPPKAPPQRATPKAAAPKTVAPKAVAPDHASLEKAARQALEGAIRDRAGWARVQVIGSPIPARLKKGGLAKQLAKIPSFEVELRQFDGTGAETHCIRIRK